MTTVINASKRLTMLLAMGVLVATFAVGADAAPVGDEDKATVEALKKAEREAVEAARWDAFSTNLVHALKADHEGVKLAAMQLVIQYGDQIDVDQAVFDVMRLYRDHADDDVRRMAVVALGQMQSRWAINFLDRSEGFEKNETVRQTIQAVVTQYRSANG